MRFFFAELLFDQGMYSKASEQYQWYFTNNEKKSEFYQASVINNVLALEKQLPTAAEIDQKRKRLNKKTDKFEMDKNSKAFIEAAKKYSREFPKGEKVPEVLRRVGVLYYAYNHFDESLVIFGELVRRYPKSKDTMIAAELTLDIFKLKDDIPGFQKTAQDLLAVPSISKSKVGADIRANLSQAALLIADNLSKSKDYKKSAENFEKFVKENPKNPSSIDAIYNSALNYQKAGDTPNAIRMYSRFSQVRTSNKKTLALQREARSNLADLYRNSGLLTKAAKQYEVVARNESSKVKKKLALNNAALIFNSLNDFGNARRVYGEYKKYISKNEAKDIDYQFAEMEYRRNNLKSASRFYERYVGNNPPDAFKLMKSVFRVADISQRTGNPSKAAKWYEKTRGTYDYFKKQGKPVGVKFAAEARFILALSKMSEIRKVKIGNSDKSIQKAFLKLDQLANQLDERMKGVIAYNYGPFIVAALTSSAQAREIIAIRWAKAPVPKGYNAPEQKAQFKQLFTSKAKEMQKVASDLFQKAYQRSLELEAYGPWTGIAQRGASRYSSDQKYKLEESVYKAETMSWGGLK
jgi:tetratricopeptide (TPR) repeat protein